MKPLLHLRLLLALVVGLVLAVLLVLLLYITDLGLAVWARLRDAPSMFVVFYVIIITALSGGGAWLVWRLLHPRPKASLPVAAADAGPQLLERLARSEAAGIGVAGARRELDELQRRRAAGEVVVALFGEISSGKSSLIRALLPDAAVETGPRGGTTRQVTHHVWTSPAGDRLVLADLPGLNEAAGTLDETARQEALRAHVVVYVCDGDLTRAQYAAVTALRALGKPLVVALNKTDRYDDAELAAVAERLRQRLGGGAEVVAIQSGGVEEVVKVYPDGREEALTRPRPPRVQPLLAAVQRCIDADIRALESLRDAAVFRLAGQKLDAAVKSHRRQQADAVVQGYARKAVAGALVAVGPGTDLLIQGYLGLNMLKELAAVYEVAVREIDLQRFLEQASGRVRPRLSVLLALAGNVFKAFPGVGTVMGGMLHAVAYGLIFDSLGKAVTDVLESRGALPAGPALRQLEDTLGEDLETRARRFARLVLERKARAAGR